MPVSVSKHSMWRFGLALLLGLVGCAAASDTLRKPPTASDGKSPPASPAPSLSPQAAVESVRPDYRGLSTDLSRESCRAVRSWLDGYGAHFECPAPKGYAVTLTMEDLRDYVAVRQPHGDWQELDLTEVTGKFRVVGPKAEWLLAQSPRAPAGLIVPLHWKVYGEDGSTPPQQHSVLAVFRVARTEVCLVGTVNAKEHRDAGERAHRMARRGLAASCSQPGSPIEP